MAYTKTIWVNDTEPAINDINLNKIEQGIYEAHNDITDIIAGDITVGRAQVAVALDPSFVYPPGLSPIGSVIMYGGEIAPTDWEECDGSTRVRIGAYSNLFSIIGTNFGEGDSTTTFNMPDMRGYFARGWDHAAGNDPEAGRTLGSTQDDAVSSTAIEHTHDTVSGSWVANQFISEGGHVGLGPSYGRPPAAMPKTGPAVATNVLEISTETRPKNVSFMYIIKVK